MKLALFDLDHTLIPFDSGLAWTRFLAAHRRLPATAEEQYLGYARQYVAGTLDIRGMHRASVAPLAQHPLETLQAWASEFEVAMAPRVPADMRALVRRHLDAGDLCAIVTATTRLVSQPFARLFGVAHLLATEAVIADGRLSGEIAGTPCFAQYKVSHVTQWLASAEGPARSLAEFEQTRFYSDSINDLPLLQAVSHPVVVRPDARLRSHAQARGWPVIEAAV